MDCLNSDDTAEVGLISRLNMGVGFGALSRPEIYGTTETAKVRSKRSARSFEFVFIRRRRRQFAGLSKYIHIHRYANRTSELGSSPYHSSNR
jgi:hypothetical protein